MQRSPEISLKASENGGYLIRLFYKCPFRTFISGFDAFTPLTRCVINPSPTKQYTSVPSVLRLWKSSKHTIIEVKDIWGSPCSPFTQHCNSPETNKGTVLGKKRTKTKKP